jgi:hypothetical protein
MVPLYVVCIVEGQGDVKAAPVLIKRLVTFVNPDVYADVRHLESVGASWCCWVNWREPWNLLAGGFAHRAWC